MNGRTKKNKKRSLRAYQLDFSLELHTYANYVNIYAVLGGIFFHTLLYFYVAHVVNIQNDAH